MTLKEEVELLERKVIALEKLNNMKVDNNFPFPKRLVDVDPFIRDMMLSPSCTAFS